MVDVVKQLAEQVVGKIAKQHEARQQLSRAEVSKLVAKANKRVARLERNNLEDSPAYQKLVNDGDVRFSVRGKDHNQLQKEVSRLNKFLESETSTVRGINRVLKDMARNTGINPIVPFSADRKFSKSMPVLKCSSSEPRILNCWELCLFQYEPKLSITTRTTCGGF